MTKRPRHGAVVTTTVPITAEVFCEELIAQLDRSYGKSLVVSSPGEALDRMTDRGIDTVALAMQREPSPVRDAAALIRWVRLLHQQRPQVVIALTPKASLLAMLASWATGVPRRGYLLVGLRADGATGLSKTVLRVMERITSAAATVVVANSPSLARRYLSLGLVPERKLRSTQPGSDHGVDTSRFRPRDGGPVRSNQNTADFTIGFIGRVTADKGLHVLLDAVERPTLHNRVRLLVVGSTKEYDSGPLVQRMHSAQADVEHVEHVADVRGHLASMDLLVLPTRREGFPNVVLEAAAMGVPVVTTTAVGAVDSVVDGVTGLLVPPEDVEALERAIVSLLEEPDRRRSMAMAGRRRAVAEFDPASIVAQVLHHVDDAGSRPEFAIQGTTH